MKKFAPLIITTPRTGSTPVCELLANIGRYTADYKNNLGEFFNLLIYDREKKTYKIDTLVYDKFSHFTDSILGVINRRMKLHPDSVTKEYARERVMERVELLKENNNLYMIKIFPFNVDTQVLSWLHQTYDFVYLERRNKLEQVLSYQSAVYHKKYHYSVADSTVVGEFEFNYEQFELFHLRCQEYKNIKSMFSGSTIYYEDLVDSLTEDRLIDLLDLDIKIDKKLTLPTRKLSYKTQNLEDLIINKTYWLEIKQEVINKISV